jgi:hypothetical protein
MIAISLVREKMRAFGIISLLVYPAAELTQRFMVHCPIFLTYVHMYIRFEMNRTTGMIGATNSDGYYSNT